MKNVDQNIQANREMQMKVPGEMAALGKEKYGITQELEAKDPSSPFSKVLQRAYGSTLKAMPGGQSLTDKQIALMPATMISDLLGKKVELSKALEEIENTEAYREATLGMQKATLANTAQHQKAEEENATAGRKLEAAKELDNRPWYQRVRDTVLPSPATKVLENQLQSPSAHFSSEEEAEAAHLPPGTVVTINGRPARVK
jgi:predicted ribosome quality control (RQC) complex YloA/Tae2 family protein